jgi:mRNA-degrading endonuclease toxin of MazEF toxin-antitoxin module
VQNDVGNRFSPLTIVVPVGGAEHVARLYPIHVLIPKGEGGLAKDSAALCNQIRCLAPA